MTTEPDFMEPEYESAGDGTTPTAGASLARRVAQIIFYGGSATLLGVMLLTYASPTFAARITEAMPQSLRHFAAGDSSGCCEFAGGCPSRMSGDANQPVAARTSEAASFRTASFEKASAATPEPSGSCCSRLSRAAMMASAASATECGKCPSLADCPADCDSESAVDLVAESTEAAVTAELEVPDATEVFAGGL